MALLITATCATEAAAGSRERTASVARGWGAASASLWAHWNALRGDAYELDGVERFLEQGTRVSCDRDRLVSYSGTTLRYVGPVLVSEPFRERLARFEVVVAELAIGTYGRAPRRIWHHGAFACRPSRNRSYRVSEHALGNAIDVVGFDFGAARQGATALPRSLRAPFRVRVAAHWEAAGSPARELHASFLRTLFDRLSEHGGVFRGMISPSHPGHADHFHFDMSPWRYVRP